MLPINASVSLNALRIFEVSARHGSFARAALELNVTPAAVSHRIKDLEAALGVTLFFRKARGVALTELGRSYRDRIAPALMMIDRATAEIDSATVDGPLSVTMPHSFAQHWLVARLSSLQTRFPGLELSMDARSSLVELHQGQADVAIRFGKGSYPGLRCEYLFGDAVSVLAPIEMTMEVSKKSVRERIESSTLLVDFGATPLEPWNTWGPWLRVAGMNESLPVNRIGFSDSSLALKACLLNLGLCIGRLSIAYKPLQKRELTRLLPWRRTEYAYYLVTKPIDEDNPRIAAFRSWLKDEVNAYVEAMQLVHEVDLRHPD